jgi:hypothetical protein
MWLLFAVFSWSYTETNNPVLLRWIYIITSANITFFGLSFASSLAQVYIFRYGQRKQFFIDAATALIPHLAQNRSH